VKPRDWLLLAIATVAVLLAWRGFGAARQERLKRLNAEAHADTTVQFLRGQLRVATRLIVQVKKVKPPTPVAGRVVSTAAVTLPAESTHVVGAKPDSADSILIVSHGGGLHLSLMVHAPPPQWTWRGEMWRDTVTLRTIVSCLPSGAARLTVTGPREQPLVLGALEQRADVCNPSPTWNPISLRPPSLVWVGAITAVVLVVVKVIH
jgi:hypothetical protein